MGIDPKPSKRSKAKQTSLPLLPRGTVARGTPPSDPPQAQTSPHQTGLLDETTATTQVTLPALHNLLESIVGVHNDGYFKLSLGDEGKTWYLAFKWQHGPWAGHYVMARVLRGDLVFAATLLAEKVIGVRAGYRKPTLDRYEG